MYTQIWQNIQFELILPELKPIPFKLHWLSWVVSSRPNYCILEKSTFSEGNRKWISNFPFTSSLENLGCASKEVVCNQMVNVKSTEIFSEIICNSNQLPLYKTGNRILIILISHSFLGFQERCFGIQIFCISRSRTSAYFGI